GPEDHTGSEFGTLVERFWKRKIPIFFGGGSNFVDVRDVALGHLLAAEKGRAGERYLLTGANQTWTDFFAALSKAAPRPIPRLRLPSVLAPVISSLESRLSRKQRARPYLSMSQAKLAPLFFFYDHAKATSELGYEPRPLHSTLADCYATCRSRRRAA